MTNDFLSQLLATQAKTLEQKQAELEAAAKYFEQDGVFLTIFKGKNAPLSAGFFTILARFDQVRLPEGHYLHKFVGKSIKCWLYQAEDLVADTETPSFKFKFFVPLSAIETGFIQMIDVIMNNGEFNGRWFTNEVTGEEVFVRRGEQSPGNPWKAEQEFVVSINFKQKGMLGDVEAYNPQQETAIDPNSIEDQTFNKLLANGEAARKRNLDAWRVNRNANLNTPAPNTSAMANSVQGTESEVKAPRKRAARA